MSETKRERYKLPVAVFMMLIKEDQILLLKRATTGWMDGFFSIPAGSLDAGEEILSAAIREAKEEVGVDVKEEDVTLANVQHCKMGEDTWINFFYKTRVWEGEPKVCETHKHSEVKWVKISELPKDIIPYVKKGIEDFNLDKTYDQFGWEVQEGNID